MTTSGLRSYKATLSRVFWSVPIVITVKDLFCSPAFIEGRGMQPTLNPDLGHSQDLALVYKFGLLRYKYERGAVYMLRSPEQPGEMLTQRLIGLEGDWVAIPGEDSIHKIQKGFCWIEGDNALDSIDSRSRFGEVPVALLEGQILCILWPPSRIGKVVSELPSERLLVRNSDAFKKSKSR